MILNSHDDVVEVWKDIKGYENKYQVSDKGNVKSLNFNNTGKERLLKPKINKYGYREVKLSKNNKTKNFLICTLVAQAFLRNLSPDKEVMHIGDSLDDSVENLKYAYRSEILHATYKRGKRKIDKPSDNRISYNGKSYKRFSDIAEDYNITPYMLYSRTGKGWTLKEALKIPKERNQRILHKKLFNYKGQLLSVKDISNKYNLDLKTIYKRLKRGWSIEETIEIPVLIDRRKDK